MTKRIISIIILCFVLTINVIAENNKAEAEIDSKEAQNNSLPEKPARPSNEDFGNMPIPSDEMTPPNSFSEDGENPWQFPPEFENGSFDFSNRIPGGSSGRGQKEQMTEDDSSVQEKAVTDDASKDESQSIFKQYSTPFTAMILLILAYVFVIFYKRKSY